MMRVLCNRPPAGWTCSLEPDHDGPCSARPQEGIYLPAAQAIAAYNAVMGDRFSLDAMDAFLKEVEPIYYAHLQLDSKE